MVIIFCLKAWRNAIPVPSVSNFLISLLSTSIIGTLTSLSLYLIAPDLVNSIIPNLGSGTVDYSPLQSR